ncbi:cell wall-binding protein [Lachnospiraceae bacterium 54-53]
MKIKRILSLVLAAALVSGLNCTAALAASRKKITTLNMTVTADIAPGGSISDQNAEITVKNSKVEVGNIEFINDGFQWYEQDVPRLEVELYAEEGYYFAVSDSSFTIKGGTYVKQKREDLGQTLKVTIELPGVSEFTRAIAEADWRSPAAAGWSPAAGAGTYEVKLYRDGKSVGTVKTTAETWWDFTGSMTKAGTYSFRVRPVNKQNTESRGEWVESPSKYVDASAAEQNRAGAGGKNGWKQDSTGWWYENGDGSYTVNNWQNIDDQWYYFNEKGYMATGWIDWNGKQYYCDPESGQLRENH